MPKIRTQQFSNNFIWQNTYVAQANNLNLLLKITSQLYNTMAALKLNCMCILDK